MASAGVVASAKEAWHRLRDRTASYLANPDPLAEASNSGAFIVWGNQPFYPLYVWMLVGHDAWPSLLTWLSTPFFFSVPLLARSNSIKGRALFVVAGTTNTLLSAKAFGLNTAVAWFLVPCLILAVGTFRPREWKVAAGLLAMTMIAALALPFLGAPLHDYTAAQARSLSHLNLWSVTVLSLYLVYAAVRAHRARQA